MVETTFCRYLPGNRIIPRLLRWCRISSIHSRGSKTDGFPPLPLNRPKKRTGDTWSVSIYIYICVCVHSICVDIYIYICIHDINIYVSITWIVCVCWECGAVWIPSHWRSAMLHAMRCEGSGVLAQNPGARRMKPNPIFPTALSVPTDFGGLKMALFLRAHEGSGFYIQRSGALRWRGHEP